MENQTAFDLNLAIRTWRENLANSPAFRRENLNELESHLRDSVASLQTRGLSAEEAFLIATRRIGRSPQLESEFGKLNRGNIWLGRALWMLIGIQVWPLFDRLMSGLAGALFVLGWTNVPHSPSAVGDAWPVFYSALIQLSALVVAVWLTWKVLRNSGKVGRWVTAQLSERFSFVLCCVIVSTLAFLLYALVIVVPMLGVHFSGEPVRIRFFIAQSQSIIAPLRLTGFTILTLLLARKQFVLEKT